MLDDIKQPDMEDILSKHYHAHLACCDGDQPYLVPTSYVFHDHAIYGYTHPGKKIDILRKNPKVCMQVDDLTDEKWKSVIIFGTCAELDGAERLEGIKLIGKSVSQYHEHLPFIRGAIIPSDLGVLGNSAIIYRITITSMSGRWFA